MRRREVLVSLGLTACSGVAWALPSPLRPGSVQEQEKQADGTPSADAAVEARLRADLARIAARGYSEEGIPVFLACVNLVSAPGGESPAQATLTPANNALAVAFRRDAAAYQHIRPGAKPDDVAQLIQILADRNIAQGGTMEGV